MIERVSSDEVERLSTTAKDLAVVLLALDLLDARAREKELGEWYEKWQVALEVVPSHCVRELLGILRREQR